MAHIGRGEDVDRLALLDALAHDAGRTELPRDARAVRFGIGRAELGHHLLEAAGCVKLDLACGSSAHEAEREDEKGQGDANEREHEAVSGRLSDSRQAAAIDRVGTAVRTPTA